MSFKNTIVIMTSNLGSASILEDMEIDPASVHDKVMFLVRAFPLLLCCKQGIWPFLQGRHGIVSAVF